jgi:hypothetical protein
LVVREGAAVPTRIKITISLLITMLLVPVLIACGEEARVSTPTPVATDTVDPSTPTPVVSPTPTVRTAAGQVIEVGQTGEINNVFITLDSIRRSSLGRASDGATPQSDRYEYLIVTLTFENKNQEQITVGGPLDEVLVWEADGVVYSRTDRATVNPPNLAVDEVTIEPGAKETGELAIELPKNATGLQVQYQIRTPLGKGTVQMVLDK